MKSLYAFVALAWAVLSASPASAISINATLTADNHYALFYGSEDGTSLTLVGVNEQVKAGTEGRFNWSGAESWSFEAGDDDYLYVVAWSDDRIRQGLLGQFVTPDGLFFSDTGWEVYLSNQDLDTGSPIPTADELSTTIHGVNWSQVNNHINSSISPWGRIAGVTTRADWIWGGNLIGGSSAGEYQVFRHAVPEPGTLALLGSALVGAGLRRRRIRAR